jgi:hypothetical protein
MAVAFSGKSSDGFSLWCSADHTRPKENTDQQCMQGEISGHTPLCRKTKMAFETMIVTEKNLCKQCANKNVLMSLFIIDKYFKQLNI